MTDIASLWSLVGRRSGHFLLESGHHGDLWLELERLFLEPRALAPLASELASRIARTRAEIVCGPLVEGAFLALQVAVELGIPFVYSTPVPVEAPGRLFRVAYAIPETLHAQLTGKRVAIVNDFINAGSAVRGTIRSLAAIDARIEVVACLATLGAAGEAIVAEAGTRLETLDCVQVAIWEPDGCPMCQQAVALEDPGGFA